MEIQQVEKNIQIAERVPPGDRWKLLNGEKVYDSLTEVLNAWYQQATVKPIAFRLEPMKGVCYIITTQEIEIPKPQPKKFDLYGDYE
jgi:hypothetical protein